ncbi:MAG: hypothetical protein OIF40_13440 [Mangrovicoccus sp.]|nr:hypothetical protein [Mangrovicoccus sp.]
MTPQHWTDAAALTLDHATCEILDGLRQTKQRPGDWTQIEASAARQLLALDRSASLSLYITALSMGLTAAMGAKPDLNAPGTHHYSFDEAWLLRLLERSLAQDAESVAFLISRRIPHAHRRSIAFLVEGLVARLMQDHDLSDHRDPEAAPY